MTELSAPVQRAFARKQSLPFFQRMVEKHRLRRDSRMLSRLDDRMLRDIGLTRYDIEILAKS